MCLVNSFWRYNGDYFYTHTRCHRRPPTHCHQRPDFGAMIGQSGEGLHVWNQILPSGDCKNQFQLWCCITSSKPWLNGAYTLKKTFLNQSVKSGGEKSGSLSSIKNTREFVTCSGRGRFQACMAHLYKTSISWMHPLLSLRTFLRSQNVSMCAGVCMGGTVSATLGSVAAVGLWVRKAYKGTAVTSQKLRWRVMMCTFAGSVASARSSSRAKCA